ncbi:MAG: hypothetical protein DHS20C11_15730 [Lysobacteraceae bacterium]|nr:MAG: hypothetical protein DHS20C11_15730 [Xanthomonadaceae bacterium]
MFGIKRFVVGQTERALDMRNRQLNDILGPGVYWMFTPFSGRSLQVVDISNPRFTHPALDAFRRDNAELIEASFEVVEVGDFEVGLEYTKGRLSGVIPPGSEVLYWKDASDIRVERVNIEDDPQITEPVASLLAQARLPALATAARQFVLATEVSGDSVGLLYVNGELARQLKPGAYAFWRFNRNIKVEHVELRLQAMEVSGQEILTKDKVSLRINVSALYQVADPVMARTVVKDYVDALYRQLQFALRAAVGTRTLDALLSDKGALETTLFEATATSAADYGVTLKHAGVKDIILPGDMKDILNQVVSAEKAAQANVIKRREETAATRSLLNTAKLMDENPTLMRLKELETLEKVTEKVDRMTVFGGLDSVLQDTVRINVRPD